MPGPRKNSAGVVLHLTGEDVVKYLKSWTDERRPPASPGGPDRPAHPGHWADVTTTLREGYEGTVTRLGEGWRLTLRNPTPYASYLEDRNGFFVLSGVADPGGPVEQALIEVAARVAPTWRVVLTGPTRWMEPSLPAGGVAG